jgi:hypothetical protein
MAQQVTITPEQAEQWGRMVGEQQAARKRQYVLVDGGMVQYGTDSVDVIDIDFAGKGGEYGLDEAEEAMHALRLMNQHGFRAGNPERERVVSFLGYNANAGYEAHHPDCDRLNSWYNVTDPYRDQGACLLPVVGRESDCTTHEHEEARLYDCNLSCAESLEDTDADLEQFTVIDANLYAERVDA